MLQSRKLVAASLLAASLLATPLTTAAEDGPVDRTAEAVETTSETTGSTVENVLIATGNVIVEVVTFPFRLIGDLFAAIA
jgi:hypothetical protein